MVLMNTYGVQRLTKLVLAFQLLFNVENENVLKLTDVTQDYKIEFKVLQFKLFTFYFSS